MKLSLVHCVYGVNPYIKESIQYNLHALQEAKVNYEYIVFNDKGDKKVVNDIQDLIDNKEITYHYSNINYGEGKCRGGWLGAIPLCSGDIFHCVDDDDVFVKEFYEDAYNYYKKTNNINKFIEKYPDRHEILLISGYLND